MTLTLYEYEYEYDYMYDYEYERLSEKCKFNKLYIAAISNGSSDEEGEYRAYITFTRSQKKKKVESFTR